MSLLDRPNLFEADFKGFFDNVKHSAIVMELKKMGFPDSEASFVRVLNQSVVDLPEVLRAKERSVDLLANFMKDFSKSPLEFRLHKEVAN